jgi:hypothetical protein
MPILKILRSAALLITITLNAQIAYGDSDLRPIYFPAAKNNVNVLPQRFEYSIPDTSLIKIGDILINADKVELKLIQNESTSEYTFKFTWPVALLNDGQMTIKDHTGRAIYSTKINAEKIKVIAQKNNEDDLLRQDIAEFESEAIDEKIINNLKLLPFLNFCVFRQTEVTKIYLCSKDLYLPRRKSTGKPQQLMPRGSTRANAEVYIDGKEVGLQGLILLNKKTDLLKFKAYAQSGASIDIETRRKDVEFKDVTLSTDNKDLTFVASGAEPVDETKVKRINSEEWQIRIPVERPIIYLKGDGNIPMRQEFFLKADPPTEELRSHYIQAPPSKTYASTAVAQGRFSQLVKFKSAEGQSRYTENSDGTFTWTGANLVGGENNKRYLGITSNDKTYQLGFETFRGLPFSALVGLTSPLVLSQSPAPTNSAETQLTSISGNLEIDWWMQNFLGIENDITTLRWGLSYSLSPQLNSNKNESKTTISEINLKYRFTPGLHSVDETSGLSFTQRSLAGNGSKLNLTGLGFFNHQNQKMGFDSVAYRFLYWMAMSGASDLKPGFSFRAGTTFTKNISARSFYNLNFDLENLSYSASSVSVNQLKLNTNFAFGIKF